MDAERDSLSAVAQASANPGVYTAGLINTCASVCLFFRAVTYAHLSSRLRHILSFIFSCGALLAFAERELSCLGGITAALLVDEILPSPFFGGAGAAESMGRCCFSFWAHHPGRNTRRGDER